MTTFKKINLYIVMLTIFQLTNCVDSKKSIELDKQYPQKSTEYVVYKVKIDIKPAQAGAQSHGPELVSDEQFTNYIKFHRGYISLGRGLERKKVTDEIKDGEIITTTETWDRLGWNNSAAQFVAESSVILAMIITGYIALDKTIKFAYRDSSRVLDNWITQAQEHEQHEQDLKHKIYLGNSTEDKKQLHELKFYPRV